MTPYYQNNGFSLYHGDVLDCLKQILDESVQCVVTSPPYWGLRDYGIQKTNWPSVSYSPMPGLPPITIPEQTCCLGLEKDPLTFVGHVVLIFREVSRGLKKDGTLWLNMGDSYASSAKDRSKEQIIGKSCKITDEGCLLAGGKQQSKVVDGLKQKNLAGIPWKIAFALQADGWFLRQDIIWHKPSPMPESVRDRCTKAHEYVFLFSKSSRYYYDQEAIKEPAQWMRDNPEGGTGVGFGYGYDSEDRNRSRTKKVPSGWDTGPGSHNEKIGRYPQKRPSSKKGSFNGKTEAMADTGQNAFRAVTDTRNKRSVWTIASRPFVQAHFATFPPELPKICIQAGAREKDIVLDPFNGAGTTGLVARELGRRYVGIDINQEYLDMTIKRVEPSLNQMTAFDLVCSY